MVLDAVGRRRTADRQRRLLLLCRWGHAVKLVIVIYELAVVTFAASVLLAIFAAFGDQP